MRSEKIKMRYKRKEEKQENRVRGGREERGETRQDEKIKGTRKRGRG